MFPSELTQMGVTIDDFYSPEDGIDENYAKARRKDFLECEAIEWRGWIDAHKLMYRQEQEADESYDNRYVLQYLIEEWERGLRKVETELYFLSAKKQRDRWDLQKHLSLAKQRGFEEFLPLKKGRCACPFHDGDNPTALSVKNGYAHCFVCDWSGDIIEFVKRKYTIGFVDAVKMLSNT